MLKPINDMTDRELVLEWRERLGRIWSDPLTDAHPAICGFQQATERAGENDEDTPAWQLLHEDNEWLYGIHINQAEAITRLLCGDVCRLLTLATLRALRRMDQ